MKELLEELRKLNEEEQLTLDEFIDILKQSNSFDDYGNEIEELREQEDVKLEMKLIDIYPSYPTYSASVEPFVSIMNASDFDGLLNDAAASYKNSKIDDYLEPFFDSDAYYEACFSDREFADLILEEEKEISNHERINYNGHEYVIIKE